jgi:flavin-dependent dehydrogenase
LARSSPILRAFFDEAAPCWKRPAAIASLPYGYVYTHGFKPEDAIYRLGDQFAVIPSFSGEGMSIALHTARLAVDSFLDPGMKAADFHRRARQEIKPQMRTALRLARIIEKPAIRSVAFAACQLFPPLMICMATHTRLRSSPSRLSARDYSLP